ncbi:ATP-binding cassette domain-containing protein [Plantibacter sp. CFBP 13570]|uniref:ATP-binding cassette domain-containing protein n=1 Tax=Plantibacter sp. CFBP 13570 TaxID=2775272 RepID=UPI0035ABB72B
MSISSDWAIEAHGLVKTFGDNRAVDGVDLSVRTGTVYGVLGPNGAGKTTTISMLATLLRPDAGTATVFGHDIQRGEGGRRHGAPVREHQDGHQRFGEPAAGFDEPTGASLDEHRPQDGHSEVRRRHVTSVSTARYLDRPGH